MAISLFSDDEPAAVVAKPVNGVTMTTTKSEIEAEEKTDKVEDKTEDQSGDKDESKTGEKIDDKTDDKTDEKKDDEKKDDKDEKKEKVIVGMECAQKNLYQKWDMHNRFTWTETYPEDLEEAAENEATEKFAILVRNKKSYDARKTLEIDSIVIQSPYLKNVLRTVLADYPGVTTSLQRLIFSAPFQPFVHRWAGLEDALADDKAYDEATRSHIKLLHDLLHTELKDTIRAVEDYKVNRVVSYEHAWTVFHPGCTIITSRYGQPVANRLKLGQYMEHPRFGPCFELTTDRLEYDGHKFGYDTAHVYIMPFAGTVPIDSLDAYPLSYHANPETVRASLLDRGKRYAALAGWHYVSYKSTAIEMKENGPVRVSIDSRIVVDAQTHGRFNADQVSALSPLNKVEHVVRKAQAKTEDENFDEDGPGGPNREAGLRMRMMGGALFYDYVDPSRDGEDVLKFRRKKKLGADGVEGDDDEEVDEAEETRQMAAALTDDQLLLASPMVKGFCLRTKKWLEFYVDNIRPVRFNEHAFDRLVLPAGHKQLVLAFTQSQVKNKHKFDDVIAGKGKGIIMLLSGGPGIGKTLTAESVAESMQVPLFVMSGGDLGMSSHEIEFNLGRVLDMVAKWNAVLLIDECDVFLEARTTADLDRNRIVSIFLRTLEYYEGILFLTTNRVSNIDEAFHSRIHISLAYPNLDAAARRQVWLGFLGANGQLAHGAEATTSVDEKIEAGTAETATAVASGASRTVHNVTSEDIDKLAELPLNGRQIKNVVKTGHLLAFQLGQTLAFTHLQTVLQIEGHSI
ncbi:hypothetical protein SBRCBS47491_001937 [Sporothrix bragantina]|uniref:AAA+ ATPase domain-containing protein n=1 Tax=Sporothrix bragantina TaxID=671064 RepID=A0ABP0B2N1_9PEZI